MANKIMYLIILINIVMVTCNNNKISNNKCQQITIPMCKGIGYNYTQMPNPFNHDSQEEAGLEVHQYWPLVEIKCSLDLKFFICSLYVPICLEDYKGSVPVCRSVCLRAKSGCEPVMTQYGFQWPERMLCDRFPVYGLKNHICMDEKKGELPRQPEIINTSLDKKKQNKINNNVKNCSCSCNKPLIKVDKNNMLINNKVINKCSLPCHLYGGDEEKQFANWWLTIWSSGCCFITFFTLLTFSMDTNRFKYPERPIVYISSCYFLVSIGYLIRIWKGHDNIACDLENNNLILYSNNNNFNYCTLVFLLIYYFGMASSFWWVNLSVTWYLAAGCKWGSEAIAAKSHLFHLFAWLLPGIGTIFALLNKVIDGDPIAGICLVGNQNDEILFYYIISPLAFSLSLGTFFLLAGFIALVRIRRVISKQSGVQAEKLEKLMIKLIVFSVLYTLPASAVIAAYFYEMKSKNLWLLNVTNCNEKEDDDFCNNLEKPQKPIYSVLMIKYFMSLAVGITTGGVWIWSSKTIETWKLFFFRKKNKMTHV